MFIINKYGREVYVPEEMEFTVLRRGDHQKVLSVSASLLNAVDPMPGSGQVRSRVSLTEVRNEVLRNNPHVVTDDEFLRKQDVIEGPRPVAVGHVPTISPEPSNVIMDALKPILTMRNTRDQIVNTLKHYGIAYNDTMTKNELLELYK